MIYPANMHTDSWGRLTECPLCCTRFAPGDRSCKNCGLSRYNLCVPQDGAPAHSNPVNARYCETCGAQTVFFRKKLLSGWRTARRAAITEASIQMNEDALPF